MEGGLSGLAVLVGVALSGSPSETEATAGPRTYTGPTAVPGRDEALPRAVPEGAVPAGAGQAPVTRRPDPKEPPPETMQSDADAFRRITVKTPRPEPTEPNRASSVVTRRELDERLPRSAPDALRWEPGVYVQQSAHGQASPYVRGLTGQQTVMFFDGIRLNNSTFRQGPNQYFFTIDSRTIDTLEVVRGSASTRYGSDALGGALLATPIEPILDAGDRPVAAHARGSLRVASADAEMGGRASVEVAYRDDVAVLAGVGYRDVGQLRSGGPVIAPQTGEPQNVPPAFEADGKTQKGTGFSELTADTRVVWQATPRLRLTTGYYDYRQFDAPRTDKCPPPTAPEDECLVYEEQFRTLVYEAADFERGPAGLERGRLTLSYQRQHEDRRLDRGSPSTTRLDGQDDVHSLGLAGGAETRRFDLAPWAELGVDYGVDLYFDTIDSEASVVFTDVDIAQKLSRGQYLDGARYVTSGAWTEVEARLGDAWRLRAGGRAALVHAKADGDPQSESAPIDRTWGTAVGNAGVAVWAVPWLNFAFNVDQGFRAPNLDDLTSRQQTGPGFQFENPDLDPERSLTLEAGMQIRHSWIEVDGWVFRTTIDDLIGRVARTADQCPENDPGCGASQTRFQLANFDGTAMLWGAEGAVRVFLPYDLHARVTVAYARGDRPNPFANESNREPPRLPISRVPPLNGTAEFGWRSQRWGVYAVGGLRWARAQTRLAPQDIPDPRIPLGGTPGFTVFDVRAGYRLQPYALLSLVFENVADTPYRYHGSSVNGPGRGVILELQFGF